MKTHLGKNGGTETVCGLLAHYRCEGDRGAGGRVLKRELPLHTTSVLRDVDCRPCLVVVAVDLDAAIKNVGVEFRDTVERAIEKHWKADR
jgi:hypothetical protein